MYTSLVDPSELTLIIAHLYGWRSSSTGTIGLLDGALLCNPSSSPSAIVLEVRMAMPMHCLVQQLS